MKIKKLLRSYFFHLTPVPSPKEREKPPLPFGEGLGVGLLRGMTELFS
jgi:hypothetical protein